MPRKKMRKIWCWRNEKRRKRSGRLTPASPLAFRKKRNKRENKHTIIAEETAQIKEPRRGSQWKGQVRIADDFNKIPEGFEEYIGD